MKNALAVSKRRPLRSVNQQTGSKDNTELQKKEGFSDNKDQDDNVDSETKLNEMHSEDPRNCEKHLPLSAQKSDDKQEAYSSTSSERNWNMKWISVGFFIVVCVLLAIFSPFDKPADKCEFDSLYKNYPQHSNISEEIWSITGILKSESKKAAVFLLLHNDTQEAEAFINELAQRVAACFGSKETTLTLKDFNECAHDYGCVIEKYKRLNQNVVVIHNLNKIPIEAVHSLHDICDVYEPYITPAFTFLTLLLSEKYDERNSYKNIANQELQKIWSDININERQALIARVTDKVHWYNGDK